MMGRNRRSESLFYNFRMEDHIPEDHLLPLVDRHIDFAFIRETLQASYSTRVVLPSILIRCEALAVQKVFTQAGMHTVESPHAKNQLV